MRILMINDHIHFGGGGDAVFRLERHAYENAGHEVFSFSQAPTVPDDLASWDIVYPTGHSKLFAKAGKFLGSPSVFQALKRLIKQVKPNLIRTHLISKYPSSIYAAVEGFPVIQTLHGPNLFCATSWGNLRRDSEFCELGIGGKCWTRGCVSFSTMLLYAQLDLRVRPSVKKVVQLFHCPSQQIQKVANSLGYGPTEYFPLGIDYDFINALPATHDGPPTVLYVGSLIESKGVLFLPAALKLIRERIPNIRLVICGRGYLQDTLQSLFASEGLHDNVEFRGFVDRKYIVELYRNAHVLTLPSIYSEQLGLVGPEALACGIPCVGSNVGGIPEWLQDGSWGYLAPPRDSTALADRLSDLLLNREKRLEFGARGREFSLSIHNPTDYQRRWLTIADKYAC